MPFVHRLYCVGIFFRICSSLITVPYVLPPATRHGVPGTVICLEGYRRLQELGGKRRETTIYTGSARRKVTAPYVQSGVDSILRPALFVVLRGMLWL